MIEITYQIIVSWSVYTWGIVSKNTRGNTRTPEVTPRNPWAIVDFIDGARDFQDFLGIISENLTYISTPPAWICHYISMDSSSTVRGCQVRANSSLPSLDEPRFRVLWFTYGDTQNPQSRAPRRTSVTYWFHWAIHTGFCPNPLPNTHSGLS